MTRSPEELEQIAQRLEQQLERMDPNSVEVDDTSDLRAIAEAVEAVRSAEARVRERVEIARARGRSWNRIALPLGVSRQAARERFADRIHV
jgi:hypothetical protein